MSDAASMLDELLARVRQLPEKKRMELEGLASSATLNMKFVPNPGPQTQAYFSKADELFYGGQAGGGKSALIVGTAYELHNKSLILRRINKDAKLLAKEELIGTLLKGDSNGWNGSDQIYSWGNNSIIFGGCEQESDKQRYKGDPHDLICFDEITDFLESQYTFITIWNRTTRPNQRCRVICTGNPPTTAEGLWVIKYWGPWLDPEHENPAKPGELRWYLRNDLGESIEVDGPGPHVIGGENVMARSRTFIPAELGDNPDLAADGQYKRLLDSLPKDLRDAYRDGRFGAGLKDDPWQMIPTAWVRQSMQAWTEHSPPGVPMCSMGVDVAQGGNDDNVIAPRFDGWFERLEVIPGKDTPLGTDVAGIVLARRKDGAMIVIDCGGGYGGSAYKHFRDNEIPAYAYKGSEGTSLKSKDGAIGFSNTRTAAYWMLREGLDPDQPGGQKIILPMDTELLSDLTAIRYEVRNNKFVAESKESMIKRLGRSPNKGDAVAMSWFKGTKGNNIRGGWDRSAKFKRPIVRLGRGALAYTRRRVR